MIWKTLTWLLGHPLPFWTGNTGLERPKVWFSTRQLYMFIWLNFVISLSEQQPLNKIIQNTIVTCSEGLTTIFLYRLFTFTQTEKFWILVTKVMKTHVTMPEWQTRRVRAASPLNEMSPFITVHQHRQFSCEQ